MLKSIEQSKRNVAVVFAIIALAMMATVATFVAVSGNQNMASASGGDSEQSQFTQTVS